ncbi:hypothetical protein RRG08_012292 [Elysia crispata]|uniref:Uncharacterized protein n=1 Tax=Elysia crispata TaxID=231223 RepID=A0AAE1BAM3_9GAST|nr:hypothetical protein RRG08_012292 [Elysia crispata]
MNTKLESNQDLTEAVPVEKYSVFNLQSIPSGKTPWSKCELLLIHAFKSFVTRVHIQEPATESATQSTTRRPSLISCEQPFWVDRAMPLLFVISDLPRCARTPHNNRYRSITVENERKI